MREFIKESRNGEKGVALFKIENTDYYIVSTYTLDYYGEIDCTYPLTLRDTLYLNIESAECGFNLLEKELLV